MENQSKHFTLECADETKRINIAKMANRAGAIAHSQGPKLRVIVPHKLRDTTEAKALESVLNGSWPDVTVTAGN